MGLAGPTSAAWNRLLAPRSTVHIQPLNLGMEWAKYGRAPGRRLSDPHFAVRVTAARNSTKLRLVQ
eukprot:scaffold9266_cov110-Isochrysis_galbana.AAC.8